MSMKQKLQRPDRRQQNIKRCWWNSMIAKKSKKRDY